MKHFLNDFLCRENVRTARDLSKNTYDTDFQLFMDRKIATVLSRPVPAVLAKPTIAQVPIAVPVAALASAGETR